MGVTSKVRLQKGCNSVLSTRSCSLTLTLREAAKYKLLTGNMSSEAGTLGAMGQPGKWNHRGVGWVVSRSEGRAVVGWWKEDWMIIILLIHTDFIYR